SQSILTDVDADALGEGHEDLFDLTHLAAGSKRRPDGVHFDVRFVAVVRYAIACEADLGRVPAEELVERAQREGEFGEELFPFPIAVDAALVVKQLMERGLGSHLALIELLAVTRVDELADVGLELGGEPFADVLLFGGEVRAGPAQALYGEGADAVRED